MAPPPAGELLGHCFLLREGPAGEVGRLGGSGQGLEMRQRLSRLLALRASLRPLPLARRLFLRQQQHLFLSGYRRGEARGLGLGGGGGARLPAVAAVE